MSTEFRVATYNVHKCKGVDWRVKPERIADVIDEFQADILAVQEILKPQAEKISERIAVPFVFGQARQHRGEPYGNAIFTRLPIFSSRSHDITVEGREARQALEVSLWLDPARALHLFAIHFGTSFFERRKQAQQFVSDEILLRPALEGARIVTGDFNEWTSGLATRILGQHLQSADIQMHLKRSKTYPALFPFLHLDHIYYDRVFTLRGMHLHRTRLALLASDHLPLVADFAAD